MATNIGVNVVEVDGPGAPSITGAAVSVAAFNVLTRRGVPNRPQRVTSFAQFVERFGSHFNGGEGAYLVRGFFDNGGRTAYVNRVVHPNAAAASRTLADAGGLNTLTFEAAYRGVGDPGAWGRDVNIRVVHSSSATSRLAEATAATVTGTAIGPAVDMSALASLAVAIDGETTATQLAFAAGDFAAPAAATLEEIRDAINRQTARLTAAIIGNDRLQLSSTAEAARLTDQWSSLQVTQADATLGFALMADPVRGAPSALNAGGTQLARAVGLTPGDAIVVADGTTTNVAKLMTIDPNSGVVTWSPDLADLAAFTDLRAVRVSNAEFDLDIAIPTADEEHIVQSHRGLSMENDLPNYAPRVLNHPLTGSRYLLAKDQVSANPAGADRPAQTAGFEALQGGSESAPTATHFIGDPVVYTGFSAFDPYDVQLVCCERTDIEIALAGIAYCEGREDAMYVAAVPEGVVEAGTAVAYGVALQGRKRYGALYGPSIIVPDPIGVGDAPRITISPVGHVMGVYARIETARGIWKAPAGDEANLLGVLDVETRLSDADHTDLVVNGAVNGIRSIPRSGIVIDASRTLSSDPRWRYVNVRLLFNYVKSSLRTGLRGARQEPNRVTLWNSIKFGTVTPFLLGLWRQGAFGTGTPEETFTVIVDETNNPPDQVQQGRLNVEVYFYPSNPAETIVIVVGQQPGGGTAGEA
jgi:hypothetical protein